MKKLISLLMVLITIFTVVSLSLIPSSAAVSAYDELSSSEYAKVYPLKTSGKGIPYYDKLLKYRGTTTYGKSSTAWYDNADYLKLIDVFKNSKGVYVAKIKYSIGKNWATAYIPLSALTSNSKTMSHTKVTSTGKFYCSAVKGGSKSLWVDKKDTVYKIAESGNNIQIMFPMTGKGYWMIAWCSKTDYNKYSKTEKTTSSAVDTGYKTASNTSKKYSVNKNVLTLNGVKMSEYPIGSKYSSNYYANVNGKTVNVGAGKCYGYARYIQTKLYGSCWYTNKKAFPNVGGSEDVYPSADGYKKLITKAGIGAHIRTLPLSSGWGHSMIVIDITSDGFTIADANAEGTNIVDIRTYTWKDYAKSQFGKAGLEYIEVYSK